MSHCDECKDTTCVIDRGITKDQAYAAMLDGHKVTHRYFSDDEYIHMKDGKMLTEEGYRFESGWEARNEQYWQDGWSIIPLPEPPKEQP